MVAVTSLLSVRAFVIGAAGSPPAPFLGFDFPGIHRVLVGGVGGVTWVPAVLHISSTKVDTVPMTIWRRKKVRVISRLFPLPDIMEPLSDCRVPLPSYLCTPARERKGSIRTP
ncbi:hypothetical protein E1A91_A09G180700v1 [Gossypium mustelinum]|uniref:Secreted protein n=1 Tax=Gossypium mustelinum TaxID=34275 RepID=A0A5D2Y2H8_GOSMU|nr:hypothetical protein E1A91_A09G180700v1 [Gossypium mustelinum]